MIDYKYKKKENKFTENGHTMFEVDVLQRLKRLAYLEEHIKQGQLLPIDSVGGTKFKYMNYFEKRKIEDKIKSDINDIKEFDEVEHFIDANFQQFLRNGEYDDNSMDLSYHYKMLKEIEADERFLSKLNFVLGKYVRGAVAKLIT